VAVLVPVIIGIACFWLLSQGAISQTMAIMAIPLCFMTVVITVLMATLHRRHAKHSVGDGVDNAIR
jgi:drug/metabolite transporter (DMT)-like permease